MQTTIDALGRIVVPKKLRDALGLRAGDPVDVSAYGTGLQVTPVSRTAQLRTVAGRLVAEADTRIDDEIVFGLVDSGRR